MEVKTDFMFIMLIILLISMFRCCTILERVENKIDKANTTLSENVNQPQSLDEIMEKVNAL